MIYAKRDKVNSTEWNLLDIYKIAPDYPVNVSAFGKINGEMLSDVRKSNDVQLLMPPTTVSRRGDLQGLILPCGLVVS